MCAAAAQHEQDQTCFVVRVGSQGRTEWGLSVKEITLCMSSRVRIASGLIRLLCFMEDILYPPAFEAGGLSCFFLAAKDMSASIETVTIVLERLFMHSPSSKAKPLH